MQQINSIGNLSRAEGAKVFFIIEEMNEQVLDFLKGTIKVLWFYLAFFYKYYYITKKT